MKNGYFQIEIMISAAYMLWGHAPRENLEKMCNLVRLNGVYFLSDFALKWFLFFKVISV